MVWLLEGSETDALCKAVPGCSKNVCIGTGVYHFLCVLEVQEGISKHYVSKSAFETMTVQEIGFFLTEELPDH